VVVVVGIVKIIQRLGKESLALEGRGNIKVYK
jgi:hypothetical protein